MPRFLADGEVVTFCANTFVGKHLDFFHAVFLIFYIGCQ